MVQKGEATTFVKREEKTKVCPMRIFAKLDIFEDAMFLRLLFYLSACSASEREEMGCQNGGTCQIVERDGRERKKCRCPSFFRGVPNIGEKCDRIVSSLG